MKVSLRQVFSIIDGRLSTKIEDVYQMLNYIFDANFYTHELPSAMKKLKEVNPTWYQEAKSIIDEIKHIENTNDFEKIMKVIDFGYGESYTVEIGKIYDK